MKADGGVVAAGAHVLHDLAADARVVVGVEGALEGPNAHCRRIDARRLAKRPGPDAHVVLGVHHELAGRVAHERGLVAACRIHATEGAHERSGLERRGTLTALEAEQDAVAGGGRVGTGLVAAKDVAYAGRPLAGQFADADTLERARRDVLEQPTRIGAAR